MEPDDTVRSGEPKRVSRRELAGGLVAGALAAAGTADGQEKGPDAKITGADVAAADRLAGRAYTDAEREQMARRLTVTRNALRTLRRADVPETVEPAVLFDPRLPGARYPTGKSSFRLSRAAVPDIPTERLPFATAVELSRLVRAQKVTSVQLTQMYLRRLKEIGPRLHCVVTLTEDLAMEQAERADREIAAGTYRGPLHGIPWGAKDLLATKGIRTTWGVKPYEDQVLDYDATVVQRLERAGAVLVAKLSLGELAMGDVWFAGRTRNPWRPEAGSSGSSAGPGAATAAGLVGFSIGSETLGSIVSPSVVNGVTGLRPTYGRVPRTGAMALSWTMDKLGPMCRGVEDCALVLSAIHGPDGQDRTVADVPFRWNPEVSLKTLRVGFDPEAFDGLGKDSPRGKLYADALAVLRRLGIQLRPVTLPARRDAYGALVTAILDVEAAASFAELTASGRLSELKQQADGSWPNVFRAASTVPAVDYLRAMQVRRQLQGEMAAALQDVDVMVTVPFAGPTLVYTNLTGYPTLVTRAGMLDGMPQTIEFVGSLYGEAAILRLGLAFERSTPWHSQWPYTEKIPPLS